LNRRDLIYLNKLDLEERKEKEKATLDTCGITTSPLEADINFILDPNFDFSSFDIIKAFPSWPKHNIALVTQDS